MSVSGFFLPATMRRSLPSKLLGVLAREVTCARMALASTMSRQISATRAHSLR
jgi:hypothetical protein